MIHENYSKEAYQIAMNNTKYNSERKVVVELEDEWRDETEWDALFEQMAGVICSWRFYGKLSCFPCKIARLEVQ